MSDDIEARIRAVEENIGAVEKQVRPLADKLRQLRRKRKDLIQSRDRVGGAKPTVTDQQIERARALLVLRDEKGRKVHNLTTAARAVGVGRATLWRRLDPGRLERTRERGRAYYTAKKREEEPEIARKQEQG